MGQTSDAVDWVGALFNAYGVVMVDAKDNIRINSDETRAALEYLKKLLAVNPPEVYAWDDAGNNRWLISGKGSGIMNPPSAWAVAKRDNPKVAENCWTHPMPKGPKGRFVAQLPFFYGLWRFSKNKQAAKDLLLYLSQKPAITKVVEASFGYDLPAFKTMYDLDIWNTVGPPVGTVYGYPPRGDEETSIAGAPARTEVAAQIYNQAINTVMVSKFTQGGEKLNDVIRWAENELVVSVSGSLDGAACALLDHLITPGREIVTVITGARCQRRPHRRAAGVARRTPSRRAGRGASRRSAAVPVPLRR